jgi:hypothetical protein
MFNAVGIKIVGDAVPEFQDLTFQLNFPTKRAGTFSVFGLGGISHIHEEYGSHGIQEYVVARKAA